MSTNNDINLNAQGVAYRNSAGAFSGIDGSTSGKVLTSNGSGVAPSFQTLSGGGLPLISSQVASGSASIIFTGLTVYTMYQLVWCNFAPSTNGDTLDFYASSNNGSSYFSANYQSGITYFNYDSISAQGAFSTSRGYLAGVSSTTNSGCGNVLMGPASVASPFVVTGSSVFNDSANSDKTSYGIIGISTTTNGSVNAIKIQCSSGNIATGTFNLYGLANS